MHNPQDVVKIAIVAVLLICAFFFGLTVSLHL